MSVNIIDLNKERFNSSTISKIALQLGESESAISKAIGILSPSVLGEFSNNSDNETILETIMNASSDTISYESIKELPNSSLISSILSILLNNQQGELIKSISNNTGITEDSSVSLLTLVTETTINSIKKYTTDNSLNKPDISNLLRDQNIFFPSLQPAEHAKNESENNNWAKGYKFDEDMGAIKMPAQEAQTEETELNANAETIPENKFTKKDSNKSSIWKWLLPILLLISAGYFLWKMYEKNKNSAANKHSTMVILPKIIQVDNILVIA